MESSFSPIFTVFVKMGEAGGGKKIQNKII
jgi:hypothetical protein